MPIRGKITLMPEGGLTRVRIDWVDGDNVLETEEFRISPGRAGCSYVSRAEFDSGRFLPGTFWLDEAGLRHFVISADPGEFPMAGAPMGG